MSAMTELHRQRQQIKEMKVSSENKETIEPVWETEEPAVPDVKSYHRSLNMIAS